MGDVLLSINGHPIHDILDYRFHATAPKLKLTLSRNGRTYTTKIKKDEYDDLGLEFEHGLMDDQHACQNNCVFCFIDQLPPGLRDSLYFKDDDARLGFLFGNYITLTNLTQQDVQRIITMRLSPINVSVHTMNPALRCRMMGNARAGEVLQYLTQFAQAGLDLNIQLVLCPGINDGDELRRSLKELLKLPTVKSIAAVPVGLTKFRKDLPPLRPFTRQEAQDVIDIFDEFRNGQPELYPSDEFFLLAKTQIPGVDYYCEFRQLENGVGLWALLKDDMLAVLAENMQCTIQDTQFILATGVVAQPLLQFFVDELRKVWHNIDISVQAITNDFLGEHITVAGLLTAQDVIKQLSDLSGIANCELLLPAAMFNQDGLTLDGMTAEDIAQALEVQVKVVANDAQALLDTLTKETP